MAQPAIKPVKLRCDAIENPLGIDSAHPRLSWQIESAASGARQYAYEVVVTSGRSPVWTSGRVESAAESVDYAGPALESGRRYSWTVRVSSKAGAPVTSAEAAWFEMGLLSPSEWKAQWIAWHDEEDAADRASGVKWIWYPGDKLEPNHKLTRYFRYVLNNTTGARTAAVLATAHESFRLGQLEKHTFWGGLKRFDVDLKPGENVILFEATSDGASGGFAALIKLTGTRLPSDGHWQAATAAGGPWQPAAVLADASDPKFGTLWPPRPAAILTKEIRIVKPVRSARLRATALGSYRMMLNGARIGEDILTPEWTDYRKRVLYQTYDVSGQLKRGVNTMEALLGYGWYGSALGWRGDRWNFGPPPPRLLAQIEVTYTDGSRDLFGTGSTWKAAESPIQYSELYGGEFYDARKEHPAVLDERRSCGRTGGLYRSTEFTSDPRHSNTAPRESELSEARRLRFRYGAEHGRMGTSQSERRGGYEGSYALR